MIFSCDEASNDIYAVILQNDQAAQYTCKLDFDRNPCRISKLVKISFSLFSSLHTPQISDRCYSATLNLETLKIVDQVSGYVSSDERAFLHALSSDLTDDDCEFIHERIRVQKNKLILEAQADEISFDFRYQQVESEGLMYFFHSVFPYAEKIVQILDNRAYLLCDQYCLNPECSCTLVTIQMVEVSKEMKLGAEAGSFSIDYLKNEWISKDNSLKVPLARIKADALSSNPDFCRIFQKRHLWLHHTYSICKRQMLKQDDTDHLKSVGRNDPCPCGSGKKYKKCCMN